MARYGAHSRQPRVGHCELFTRVLGRALHRPASLPMPAVAARLALGEMADQLLLANTRVAPRRLMQTGYAFEHPTLEEALQHCLT